MSPRVGFQDWIDHFPGSLNCVLTCEEGAIACHSVAQEPLVRRFLSRLFFDQVEFSLVAASLPPFVFDTSGKGDSRTGRESESQIVAPSRLWYGVSKKRLWRRL
jgi:hypothetical protein